MKAVTLLEDVAPFFKGTQDADYIVYLIADCYYKNKDYQTAISYYNTYYTHFPRGNYAKECKYMVGYGYYLQSPDPKLDQTTTNQSIVAFKNFIEIYPTDERVAKASDLILELQDKLVYKDLLNAQLYYKLGNYQGNNYKSAIIVANNALNNYPYTKYREELAFVKLKSKYMQAEKSIQKKKEERFRDAIDEYYAYVNEFANGKYKKDADKILSQSKKNIKD
jgi:outer membrane protein assembly factor BamD